MKDAADELNRFVSLMEHTLDLNALVNHEYTVNAEFSDQLRSLKKTKDSLRSQIDSIGIAIAADLGLKQDKVKVDNSPIHGYCLRISRKEHKLLDKKGSKYMKLQTSKDGIRFTTAKLKSLSVEYANVIGQYSKAQEHIVNKSVEVADSYSPVFESICELLSELDVLVSFAETSAVSPVAYVRPKITAMGTGDLVLKDSRHPVVEAQTEICSNFIPNDIVLHREHGSFCIITGPNMGGKSTYIRQAGVCVLLAQIGCFVPCSYAEVPICDAIFARIGASDNQARGVSTFMHEMLETASILKAATPNSLLIIDELGRGTSIYDGCGLAWAISTYIATEIRGFCLFATHFHELTALQETLPGIRNVHVTAQLSSNGLAMLYKVKEGACDRSFGIHVAELSDFPDRVIENAKRKAEQLENFEFGPSNKLQRREADINEENHKDSFESVRDAVQLIRTSNVDSMEQQQLLSVGHRLLELLR
eukprot:GILJ01012942.1.p1 GENE.GILJ01012942.1~~GILJ01012942.1.p1  ORF type:complete len:492 (+),score=87.19 GILJ01012942.1:48-1478(+)